MENQHLVDLDRGVRRRGQENARARVQNFFKTVEDAPLELPIVDPRQSVVVEHVNVVFDQQGADERQRADKRPGQIEDELVLIIREVGPFQHFVDGRFQISGMNALQRRHQPEVLAQLHERVLSVLAPAEKPHTASSLDVAGIRCALPGDDVGQGGLAGARSAEDEQRLARVQLERHVAKRNPFALSEM